jgi:hypothetical protein
VQDGEQVGIDAVPVHSAQEVQLDNVLGQAVVSATTPHRRRFATHLSIGGFVINLSSDDRRLVTPPPGILEEFLIAPQPADLQIDASWCSTIAEPEGTPLFDSGGAWRLLRAADGSAIVVCRSALGPDEPYLEARFDAVFATAVLRLNARHFNGEVGRSAFPLDYPVDEVAMVHLLSRGRGVEIHGCGVRDEAGRAWVFAGQSGAGKSTIGRLWAERPDVTVLSDERVVLRTDGDRVIVWGTPFHGDAILASPASAELAGIFFLRHGDRQSVVPIEGARARAQLMSCAFLPFYDPRAVASTLDAVERALRSAPAHEFFFVPNSSALDFVSDWATSR